MSEINAVDKVCLPHTINSLIADFRDLGVKEDMTLIVHSSLSSLGWVSGGAEAVIRALISVVGEGGTIVMPAQSAGNSDPAGWMNPPVPESWWPIIRESMPAFCKETTPTRGMGAIAELFRRFPGVERSDHPMYSFAAWGKNRTYITENQPLSAGFGYDSPLAKIYELNGKILMIGVSHESNTSLHLAEHSAQKPHIKKSAAIVEDGERVWKTYNEIEYDSECFNKIGFKFESKENYNIMKIGNATCKLIDQRSIVDYGRRWFQEEM